jgi:hypothetical protein
MNHPNKPSNETPEFDLFWKYYPIKVGKAAALKAWVKAIKIESADEILAGAIRYADDPNRHPSFTAHAATWLNAHRWNDSALPPRVLTPEERREKELAESRAKSEKERLETLRWQQEIREAEARSVPPPADIVEFLRKTLPKR